MHVLFVSEYFYPKIMGGGELSVFLLSKGLVKKGTKVSILTSRFKNLPEEETVDGIKIYRRLSSGSGTEGALANALRLLFSASVRRETARFLSKQKVDIVHALNTTSIPGVSMVKSGAAKKIAHLNSPLAFCPKGDLIRFTKENPKGKTCDLIQGEKSACMKCMSLSPEFGKLQTPVYLSKQNPLFRYFVWKRFEPYTKSSVWNSFDVLLPIGSDLAFRLGKIGVDKKKITILPNIIELGRFLKVKRKNAGTFKVLYLGALITSKGPQVLLNAVKQLKENFEVHLYGRGSLEQDLQKSADPRVFIHKPIAQEDLPNLLSEYDVLVFPSLVPEGFGRVALEAAAAGLPVIASRIGGIPDIVSKETGILVKPGDEKDLANAIKKLLANSALREKLGKNARVRAKNLFSPNKIINKCIGVYRKVLK